MAIKIVEEVPVDKSKSGKVVSAKQIKLLSENLFKRLWVVDGPCEPGNPPRQTSCTNPKTHDTKTAYFTKKEIYKLFRSHKGSDGLLLSFGIHDSKIYGPLRECTYENKLMVVLITTTDEVPNLEVNNKVIIAGAEFGSGDGQDNGKLCPPDTTCKSANQI